MKISLILFDQLIQQRVLFSERYYNFIELAIILRRTFKVKRIELVDFEEIVKQLSIFGKVYFWIAYHNPQTEILQSLTISYFLELKGASLKNSINPR